MFRISAFLLIIIIIALIWFGVLEVKIHPDKLGQLPGTALSFLDRQDLGEQIRVGTIRVKRSLELQFLAREDERKAELALMYLETDTQRLSEIIKDKANTPQLLVPQIQLLTGSIKRVKDLEEQGKLDGHFEAEANKKLTQAQLVLDQLKDAQAKNKSQQEKLDKAVGELEQESGGQKEGENGETVIDDSPIPLRF